MWFSAVLASHKLAIHNFIFAPGTGHYAADALDYCARLPERARTGGAGFVGLLVDVYVHGGKLWVIVVGESTKNSACVT